MEISKTLETIYKRFEYFKEFFWKSEDSKVSNVKRSELEEYLLTSNKEEEELSPQIIQNFLGILFDETEENREEMPRDKFVEKYGQLLKILEKDLSEDEQIDQEGEQEVDEFKVKDFYEKIKKECASKNAHREMPNIDEKDHSEILQNKEKSVVFNSNEISLDPSDLFHDFNFNDSVLGSMKSDNENRNFDYADRRASVVKPINTFKFEMELNLNDELKNKITGINSECQIPKHSTKNIITQSQAPVNLPSNFINYQHNININVNNYGNLNFNSLSNSTNFQRTSNINQKIQEVFFELNRPNKNINSTPYNIIKKTKLLEEHPHLKKETFLKIGNKRDDYFVDLCKSITYTNKNNASLKHISDRIMKKEIGWNTNMITFANNYTSTNHNYVKPCVSIKNKKSNLKFMNLEKMLRTEIEAYNNDDFIGNSSPVQKNIINTNQNFEDLELQLHSLTKRNKTKSIYSAEALKEDIGNIREENQTETIPTLENVNRYEV